jgi:1,4-alpha-glucan branching enzyme
LLYGCREAELIGDFNNWNGVNHRMKKDGFGVWSLKIPHVNGKPAIPHNSKVKFRFRHGNGEWVDRIPAWIRYATFDASKFGASYDGVHWDPPACEWYKSPPPKINK